MQEPLDASLVRICTANRQVVGAGFLVSERHILTCAHVVGQALGLPDFHLESPQGAVLLDFPLVSPHTFLTASGVLHSLTGVAILRVWSCKVIHQLKLRSSVLCPLKTCGNMTSACSAFPKATMMGCGPPDGC